MEFVVVKNPYESSSTDIQAAADKHIRAQLMVIIRKMIQERGLSQTKAAKLLGTTQTRISEIVNGKIENHSIDKLFMMLSLLGWDFQFGYTGGVVTANAEKADKAA
ncbi:helix-turn-helix domain-containing protein [Pantoea agglomerans]|uniref:helix-turn-helix domain-containing protein n=1 Tax=Enterobacter agglomerans TaxID=549 RepID=UPI00301C6020